MKNEYVYAIAGLLIGVILTFAIQGLTRCNYHGMERVGEMHEQMTHGSTSMSDAMMAMNESLKGKTGDEFDKAFLSEMTTHHQGAIEMAKLALENAKHQEIKDLAKAIISAQTSEIEQMKQWQQIWYK